MNVSQKCQYALRAVLELAKRRGEGPTRIATVAEAQKIPVRFLEQILGQLRQGGFVESRRGVHGGYLLSAGPGQLSVGQIIEFIDGPLSPVQCLAGGKDDQCPLLGECVFLSMWSRARDAVANVYDRTTFQDLIDQEETLAAEHAPSYSI